MAETYWAEREGARWDVYGKQRGWMAQADTEDDARLIVAGLEALQAPPAAAATVPALEVFRIAGGDTECCTNPTAEDALECLRDLRKCYDEALQAPPAAAVPEGYALVPVEPNNSMQHAGVESLIWDQSASPPAMWADQARNCWAAMLAANKENTND